MNEPNVSVLMKGIRGENKSPYDFAKEALEKVDNLDTTLENEGEVNKWRMTVVDDGNYSNIVFYKERSVDNRANPSITLSYNDNLKKYSYKIIPISSVFTGTTEDGQTRTYIDGNTPTGIMGKELKGKFKNTADITDAALKQIEMDSVEFANVEVDVGKLAYHSLGDTIKLNVPEEELHSITHRIKSKKISYSHNKGTIIKLGLNRDIEIASEYLKS